MQETIYATIGDTLAISTNINTKDDIIVDKVEFSCNDLYIQRDLVKLDNNLYSCEFKPYETQNFKCGFYTATISVYIGDIVTSKTISLYVQDNPNKGELEFNPQEITATPTKEIQVVVPNDGYVLSKVTINPIPNEYIVPSGELEITENGTYNVREYETIKANGIEKTLPSKTNLLINNKLEELTAEDIAIDGKATKIRAYAFAELSNLKKIEIPNNTLSIGNYAFYNCSNLELSITNNNITSVGNYAFYNCKKLKDIILSNSSLGDIACQNTSINKIKVKQCGYSCFHTATISKLEISEGATSCGGSCFSSANIGYLILPTTFTSVSSGFWGLSWITNLISKASNPPTIASMSTNISRVFVQIDYINAYQNATNWSALSGRFYPLVNTFEDLANVTNYQYACVKGNELGIEDENNYKIYQYIDGQWYEVA